MRPARYRRAAPRACAAILVVASLLAWVPGASATFPGPEGRIAVEGTAPGPPGDTYGGYAICTVMPGVDSAAFVTELSEGGPGDNRVADFKWSADGRRLVFDHVLGSFNNIGVINADGSGFAQLTHDPFDRNAGFDGGIVNSSPTWSPDGRYIAFARDGELWVMDADGSNAHVLVSAAGTDFVVGYPDWSPDGSRIAFTAHDRFGPEVYIDVVNADGSGRTRITKGVRPVWSPDGSQLVYQRQDRSADDSVAYIGGWRIRLDGSQPVQITPANVDVWSPVWSPAGRLGFINDVTYLAYEGIDAMNLDGSGLVPVVHEWWTLHDDGLPYLPQDGSSPIALAWGSAPAQASPSRECKAEDSRPTPEIDPRAHAAARTVHKALVAKLRHAGRKGLGRLTALTLPVALPFSGSVHVAISIFTFGPAGAAKLASGRVKVAAKRATLRLRLSTKGRALLNKHHRRYVLQVRVLITQPGRDGEADQTGGLALRG